LLNEDIAKGTAALSSLDANARQRGVPSTLPVPQRGPAHHAEHVDRMALQSLIWNAAGIERNAAGLEAAARRLDQWQPSGTTMQDLETANLLALGRVLVAAALARRESRGAHFREDFPETSEGFRHSLVYCQEAKAVSNAC
jgi:L-aspartate oxidase